MAEWFRALDFNSIAPDSNPTLATSWRCFSVVGVQLIEAYSGTQSRPKSPKVAQSRLKSPKVALSRLKSLVYSLYINSKLCKT